ncbi:hypothetical protein M427DRAFT_38055 [Gonapodya prolifera JEL478]|uniref:BZIP domain-containing protein n=1 Tax=Gonapodya prolifera (strain JEL478) TaxID=1344416 RepID=A0A138ZZL9_GONPJ|nr:hypothetical protein M427DRAFT_38055 [Gonapodya prolifera JEL478]|eukprot:KXS09949.1 hypothetical protein M427DRAFT_38055 [Gonapodya prolifera JEL478]
MVLNPPSSDPTHTSPSLSLTSTSPLSTFSSGSSHSSFSQRGSATPTTQLAAYPSRATSAGSAHPILAHSSAKGQVRALGIRRPGPPAALGNEPRGTKRSVSGLDHEDGERDNFDRGRKCKVQAHGKGHHDTVYHEGHADGGESAHLQDKEGLLLLDAGDKSPLTLPIPAPGHGLRDDPLRTTDPALLAALLAPVRRRRRRTEEEDVVDEDTKKRRTKNTEAARRSRLRDGERKLDSCDEMRLSQSRVPIVPAIPDTDRLVYRKSLALAQLELRVNSLTASNEALQARVEQLEKERDEWRRRAEARKDELGQWEEKIEELHGEMNARGIVVPSADSWPQRS